VNRYHCGWKTEEGKMLVCIWIAWKM
jgi:hypothetical protein